MTSLHKLQQIRGTMCKFSKSGPRVLPRSYFGPGEGSSSRSKWDLTDVHLSPFKCTNRGLVVEKYAFCNSLLRPFGMGNNPHRCATTVASDNTGPKEGEIRIKKVLNDAFPSASQVIVTDISGGCGSMYQVYVETEAFQGLSIVKQHQMINKALQKEIKGMHGIRIQTDTPLKR